MHCDHTHFKGSTFAKVFIFLNQIISREAQMVVNWPDGDDLAKVQLIVVDLSDKYCSHGFVEGRAIHVDGSAHWQHEADDAAVDVVVLQQALKGDRQRGRAGEIGRRKRRSKVRCQEQTICNPASLTISSKTSVSSSEYDRKLTWLRFRDTERPKIIYTMICLNLQLFPTIQMNLLGEAESNFCRKTLNFCKHYIFDFSCV